MWAAYKSADAPQRQGDPQALDNGDHHHDEFEMTHEPAPSNFL
jgi:hypothetical protein